MNGRYFFLETHSKAIRDKMNTQDAHKNESIGLSHLCSHSVFLQLRMEVPICLDSSLQHSLIRDLYSVVYSCKKKKEENKHFESKVGQNNQVAVDSQLKTTDSDWYICVAISVLHEL